MVLLVHPGLSVFFNQVLAFSGNEFYVKYFPTLVGKTFRMSFDMVLGYDRNVFPPN